MFRLTREVRFAVDDALPGNGANTFAASPPLIGLSRFFALRVTVCGELNPATQYLVNIHAIDDRARQVAVGIVREELQRAKPDAGGNVVQRLFAALRDGWPGGLGLDSLSLVLSPFLRLAVHAKEPSMVHLTERFEFSAGHRLHNPAMSEEENRGTYGKCNNPAGHGHNYEVEVTLAGRPDEQGVVIGIPEFERIVQSVIEPLDHKNLNTQVPEFRELIPTVENIAAVIYRALKPKLASNGARLASVTVWETPKTWCEYFE